VGEIGAMTLRLWAQKRDGLGPRRISCMTGWRLRKEDLQLAHENPNYHYTPTKAIY
jgi:hypothetical protein